MKTVKLILIICIGAIGLTASANEPVDSLTIRHIFSKLSEPSLDILPVSTRLDMLDYYDTDSIYRAKNSLGGYSELIKVTPGYLKLKISDASDLQIKILPSKKSGKIIMTIYTVGGDSRARDSELRFYNPALQELPGGKIIRLPKLKDFFSMPRGSLTSMKEIEQMVPFTTMEFNAEAKNSDLTAHLTVGEYINNDDYNIMKLFLKPGITYRWQGDKFKLEK